MKFSLQFWFILIAEDPQSRTCIGLAFVATMSPEGAIAAPAKKDLSPTSFAPVLGPDTGLPTFRDGQPHEAIEPAQNQYPVHYFVLDRPLWNQEIEREGIESSPPRGGLFLTAKAVGCRVKRNRQTGRYVLADAAAAGEQKDRVLPIRNPEEELLFAALHDQRG
ncbi:hypothetical protein BDY21DRAFT_425117 [Lineolata rhizophorae]|uniref:Uncharacterized protein n=1 Tax=Lineolata rhizophorae TaxID=578093 RepID=A0A6A6NLJ0_9PEZI|nr:hypothetical protein BDY21DRAFT_425117 [Lineolata rhizophorae]